MGRRQRFIRSRKIAQYVETAHAPLNQVQDEVAARLGMHAQEHSLRWSKRALEYMFGAIETEKLDDLTREQVMDALEKVITQVRSEQRNETEISNAVLVRTFRRWPCPRPWC
ncbi:hypothetical protein [Massilia litorea]|jgi:hypothetical protein|uniref:Uncharacterized protein n=1 Tax=Massilia litorea TaxID=2769491 RepID=A0A7L9U674_9BURK|nr:hypothetical protein [Massilia litorea]QOL50553.1 hypothetical protein LPB04_04360 [Massilia litorea]